MALIDSRLGPGTLSLGTTEYGAQISNVRLVPSHDEVDGTPTLATPEPASTVKTKWALSGSAIQDWESATGFVEYCRDNNGVAVAFTWVPNTSKGVTFAGECVVKAVEIGGDINAQISTDFEFQVVGSVTRTDAP